MAIATMTAMTITAVMPAHSSRVFEFSVVGADVGLVVAIDVGEAVGEMGNAGEVGAGVNTGAAVGVVVDSGVGLGDDDGSGKVSGKNRKSPKQYRFQSRHPT